MQGPPDVLPWRFGRTFATAEIARFLVTLESLQSRVPPDGSGGHFERCYSEAIVAREAPGPPVAGGAYETACELSARYEFSDPRIVIGHFESRGPLLGRPLLLELRVLGLHVLAGVRINAVEVERATENRSVFAWRYDTLPGHVEFGSEWFRVIKHHDSGEVLFQIEARWRPGEFRNWWMRTGFRWVVRHYQRAWHRLAYVRMRRFLGAGPLPALPSCNQILHAGTVLVGNHRKRTGLPIHSGTAKS